MAYPPGSRWFRKNAIPLSLFLLIQAVQSLRGQPVETTTNSPSELKKLSIEELLNMEVTTVSRQAEPWFTSPSAIQVITGEEIRRSGASSIPEALRLAPNLQVAQVDSANWAISARGFNNTTANKLQVMIDGRSVYTPLFSGVFWDVQDTLLEDVDRIEVVSGPGGTLWGANAVNGVINIVTKSAKDTQGSYFSAGGGSFLNGFGEGRYGGQIGTNLFFRVYGKYFEQDDTNIPFVGDATNAWRFGQGGFRLDYLPDSGDTLTLEGNGYGGDYLRAAPGNQTTDGQNIITRWTHVLDQDSDVSIQAYWDRTYRHVPDTFTETLNTYDLDFQHRFPLGNRQMFVWGLGYRAMMDQVGNGPPLAFLPDDRNLQLFSGFAQDEFAIIPERLRFTVGTKLEHNDFTGWEVQPSGRLAWTPNENNTLWGAISRAVRSPSRFDTDLYIPNPANPAPAGTLTLIGGPFDSEKLLAYELGYRARITRKLGFSLATFYNSYDDIRSVEAVPGATDVFDIGNGLRGQSWGVELSSTLQVLDNWRLRGGYTYLHKDIWNRSGHHDLNNGTGEGNDPEHQVVIQSMLDLPYHLSLDTDFRYVDRLPTPHVPSYLTFDVRVAWQATRHMELSIVGQNLWDPSHPEFGPPGTRQEIPRSVYGKITWRF
ncbi:MAG TPA: TonB-dependent receptor [Candidatus Dormibacteraeota bacterium]|nr:TonB-dependent receptor [Candidatus Dormibacteraeota bacterium]